MLIDRYLPEDVFARVPELADQTDPVLVHLDRLLDDDDLYQQVRHDLAQRYRLTPVHGRHSTPAEVLLRLLVVQHLYNWGYAETVAQVADSLVLRWFCRVYFQRVPDKTTLLRWAQTIQPATLQALIDRAAQLAQQAKVTRARKLRIDSTCVQTPIHHPTDSSLLGDGVRVLTRLLQRAKPLVQEQLGGVRDAFRSRLRTVRGLLRHVHRTSRLKGEDAAETQRELYARLLETTRQTVRQAERQAERVQEALMACREAAQKASSTGATLRPSLHHLAERLQTQFARFLPLVQRVLAQAEARVLDGRPLAATEKVLSLFFACSSRTRASSSGARPAWLWSLVARSSSTRSRAGS